MYVCVFWGCLTDKGYFALQFIESSKKQEKQVFFNQFL